MATETPRWARALFFVWKVTYGAFALVSFACAIAFAMVFLPLSWLLGHAVVLPLRLFWWLSPKKSAAGKEGHSSPPDKEV